MIMPLLMLLVRSHVGTPEKIVRKKIKGGWERGDRMTGEREEPGGWVLACRL